MTDDPKKPPFDWIGQIQYFLLFLVATVAVLILLRYFGIR